MKTDSCYESPERRQLDLIQRVGRIGYWEYDPAQRTMTLGLVQTKGNPVNLGPQPKYRQIQTCSV